MMMMVMEEGIEISLAAVPSLQRTPLSNCFLLFLHQNSTLFFSFFLNWQLFFVLTRDSLS